MRRRRPRRFRHLISEKYPEREDSEAEQPTLGRGSVHQQTGAHHPDVVTPTPDFPAAKAGRVGRATADHTIAASTGKATASAPATNARNPTSDAIILAVSISDSIARAAHAAASAETENNRGKNAITRGVRPTAGRSGSLGRGNVHAHAYGNPGGLI